jgi:lipopolysaccharide/colanic/teichoic acid biosynthesis glycosyltransferase
LLELALTMAGDANAICSHIKTIVAAQAIEHKRSVNEHKSRRLYLKPYNISNRCLDIKVSFAQLDIGSPSHLTVCTIHKSAFLTESLTRNNLKGKMGNLTV